VTDALERADGLRDARIVEPGLAVAEVDAAEGVGEVVS
jgi:hypothetical protein